MLQQLVEFKSFLLIRLGAVLIIASAAAAQMGTLSGYVITGTDSERDTIAGAVVRIDYLDSETGLHLEALTMENGQFNFENLLSGVYSVTTGCLGFGFATEVVEVNPRIPTLITLMLEGGIGVGEFEGVHSARGVAHVIVNPITQLPEYFLDVGGDSTLDYRLQFGAWWYSPPGDPISRPNTGDLVYITGSPFGYSSPPMLIVRELNSHQWLNFPDHGGEYAGFYYLLGCTTRTIQRIEAFGSVELRLEIEDSTTFFLHDVMDSMSLIMDFGADNYRPNSGVSRPTDLQNIHIVGGLVVCMESPVPRVIVYEINGELWRIPGDTTGFGDIPVNTLPDRNPSISTALSHAVAANYPNPFNASTTIKYSIPESGPVQIRIYDLVGRIISTLVDSHQAAGSYTVAWDGSEYASGIYLCEIAIPRYRSVHRMVLLK